MNKLISLIIFLQLLNLNSQEVYVQGGGTLDDWANLKKYKNENEELIKNNRRDVVVFMGNSITEGWSYFSPDFFIENQFINRGIGGQTTPQMLIRFKPDVVSLKPKSVVILAGIMAEIAKANKIKVYICSVLPAKDFPWSPGLNPSKKVIKLNKMLIDYCYKNNIKYVDYYSKMNDGKGGLKVPEYTSKDDLVHPNKRGYSVMESVILDALN